MFSIKNIVFLSLILLTVGVATGQTVKTLYVSDTTGYCPGIGTPQKCLLVREDLHLEWTYYPNSIRGFKYREGEAYELLVRAEEIANPYNDPAAVEYTLIRVLHKTKTQVPLAEKAAKVAPQKNALSTVLAGNWKLAELNNRPIADSARISIRFAEQNRYGGDSGCNHYGGSYAPASDSIHFSPGPMTRMACFPNEIMKLESEYLQTLRKAVSFKQDAASLTLLDASGNAIAKFTPLPNKNSR